MIKDVIERMRYSHSSEKNGFYCTGYNEALKDLADELQRTHVIIHKSDVPDNLCTAFEIVKRFNETNNADKYIEDCEEFGKLNNGKNPSFVINWELANIFYDKLKENINEM